MKHGYIAFCLALILVPGLTIHATTHDWQASFNTPIGNASYPFGILRYTFFSDSFPADHIATYFEFDTEAIYLQIAYYTPKMEIGGRLQSQIFDWQNLANVVDPRTGTMLENETLNGTFLNGTIYAGVKHPKAWYAQIFAQFRHVFLRPSRDSKDTLSISSHANWFRTGLTMGLYRLSRHIPGVQIGERLVLEAAYRETLASYTYEVNGEISTSVDHIPEIEILAFFGKRWRDFVLQLQARAGLLGFAAPGHKIDYLLSYSVGGPEIKYRRIAGFAYSEFRVPAFFIANIDMHVPLIPKTAFNLEKSPLYLWVVLDTALFDRKADGVLYDRILDEGKQIHMGGGLGLYFTFLDHHAVSFRTDFPFTAGRNSLTDYWQFFILYQGSI